MANKRRKLDAEYREGAVRIVTGTGKLMVRDAEQVRVIEPAEAPSLPKLRARV
ncbi:hypothetical protein [Streptomyces sp. YIM S03343]